jgi:hypothetical protein
MKNNMNLILRMSSLFLMTWIFVACDDQAQERQPITSDIELEDLSWVQSKTALNVTLWTTDGNLITDGSQLQPDTLYHLMIKSDAPISLKVKLTDGFTVEEIDPAINSVTTDRTIRIRTVSGLFGNIYINVVPILYQDNELIRERPQSFLLPIAN